MRIEDIMKNKTILITGGTGFLWRALTKRLLSYNPQSIRIFSRDEVKHYIMQKSFNDDQKLRFLIGDVRDLGRLEKAMKWVDYVIHAAAMKRLDMIEYNTEESVKTNIIWTLNVVKAAESCGVKKLVFISTDKSCSPMNTYGWCKFVAERIVTEYNFSNGNSESVFTSVRYGNVVNSTGSIVPFLVERVKSGLDFPLTDPRMTRFLITEDQAIDLIMKAFVHGIGWEVFVPQLPAVKISDLMVAMNLVNGTDREIRVVGIRPWEKIDELMINEMEWERVIAYEGMYIIGSSIGQYKTSAGKSDYTSMWQKIDMKQYSSWDEIMSIEDIVENFSSYLRV